MPPRFPIRNIYNSCFTFCTCVSFFSLSRFIRCTSGFAMLVIPAVNRAVHFFPFSLDICDGALALEIAQTYYRLALIDTSSKNVALQKRLICTCFTIKIFNNVNPSSILQNRKVESKHCKYCKNEIDCIKRVLLTL